MDDETLRALIAVGGALFGALGGAWVQSRLQLARERITAARALRLTMYLEMSNYLQRRETLVDYLVDEWPFRQRPVPPPDVPHPERISAQVRLLAPPPVRAAWKAFLLAEDAHRWNINENGYFAEDGNPQASPTDPNVTQMRKAIKAVDDAIRADMA